MGCTPSEEGVRLLLRNADGDLDDEVFGEHVKFFARRRPVDPESYDEALGSRDWLTLVCVADTPERLAALSEDGEGSAYTSSSSCQVTLAWWVGDADQPSRSVACYTIADNPVRANPPGDPHPEVEVAALDVFPPDTNLAQLPPEFRARWLSGIPLPPP